MEFINYMQPCYGREEIDAVTEYMNSGGWLTEFRETRRFEESIAGYTSAGYCSVMANGTVTLSAALMAAGVGPGDEVVVPDFTMSATAHAAAMLGAQVVFADVEPETFCMDYDSMREAVSEKTKAVIYVDLNGRYSRKFKEIIAFCRERHILLIEDAAQALGSSCQGKALGTFGDAGSFSFSMPKIITTGQGGALITDDRCLYEKLLKIRDFGRERAGSDHYLCVGGNFKFTDLQAVVGLEQMKKLPERVLKKKRLCRNYDALLEDIRQVAVVENNYTDTAPCFYELLSDERDRLAIYLEERKIGARKFYPPLHSEPAYGYDGKRFPAAEEISARGLWLPSSVLVTEEQVRYICGCIRKFYS